ncbi:MAG: small multi-drug export protein [bacterium]|nr:small multi-drug export protein [bacterium]
MWIKLLSVFGFGVIGLWEGIPAGFALRLHPLVIGALSAAGSLSATLLVLLLGDRIRTRLARPRTDDGSPRGERMIDRVWQRYGIVGLGLLSPCLTGAPIGVALGLFLRAPAGRLLWWTTLGILLWTVILTVIGMLGSAGVLRLLGRA